VSNGGTENKTKRIDTGDAVNVGVLKWRSQILDKLPEALCIRKQWSYIITITACRSVNEL
jgi:hypothetical protein